MFRQDTDESFETAQDRSVNHNRSNEIILALLGGCPVLELEAFRQVEIELYVYQQDSTKAFESKCTHLNCGTLEFSLQGVANSDIDLGTVELRAD